MAMSPSTRFTPEASLGLFAVASITIVAIRWSARAGKERGWDDDRVKIISNRIGIATFLIGFVIAYMAQNQIADLLEYLKVLLR